MLVVTHDGSFHADDVFSMALIQSIYPHQYITRTRDQEIIDQANIVFDVGGIYDPSRQRFDHHQKEGAGERLNGVRYSSFGLVWAHYGQLYIERYCAKNNINFTEQQILLIKSSVDQDLIQMIDAIDCGQISIIGVVGKEEIPIRTFSDMIETFNELENGLEIATGVASNYLLAVVKTKVSACQSEQDFQRDIDACVGNDICVLSNRYSDTLFDLLPETSFLYAVYPRSDGTWSCLAIPDFPRSFNQKRPFPPLWAGLTNDNLQMISNVKDAIFCHRNLFLAGAKSREGAIMLGKMSLGFKQ